MKIRQARKIIGKQLTVSLRWKRTTVARARATYERQSIRLLQLRGSAWAISWYRGLWKAEAAMRSFAARLQTSVCEEFRKAAMPFNDVANAADECNYSSARLDALAFTAGGNEHDARVGVE
jgi:hypothetical protein